MGGKEVEMEPDVRVIYYAKHDFAGPDERQEGRKLGRIVDKGYRVLTREGVRFEISTLDWGSDIGDKSGEFSRVTKIIEQRLGKKGLNIEIS